ncbi:N-acetyllactosaminide beta-1,3-N-acetylglucosaminyltransferase 2-like [Parambassis ranga]|uniref:Hexosyltransferase n=1 Tax=Parambassis ranga TaxID=210632 RepID=A0A6P7J661_9TELE|nr:N-acetyllactosaminide beta-1,3-N-acetylglucosaminyltransferase 2-like [Parambassis ranga]XP_028272194.1 N-acetyllactosaminide beta-1,3-N-acetylglucosaminyltransferase 2-like [Parambassis ranga]
MAQCHCRWRNVFICVCAPCICLVVLFFVFGLIVCMNMNTIVSTVFIPQTEHFVARGTLNNKSFAAFPKTFWDLRPNRDAFWNNLQLKVDRHFNPMLQPGNDRRGSQTRNFDSLLKQSFFEVTHSNEMKKTTDKMPQTVQQFASYMLNRDYPIILRPNGACGAQAENEKEPPLLLFAVKTSEANFKNRQALRQTWAREGWVTGHKIGNSSEKEEEVGGYVRRIFLLGKEDAQELGADLSEILKKENKLYGDLLQWDFKDTFFNLTLKDVLFWKWFSVSCSRVQFVFKGDDDVFVNTPKMITYLQHQLKKPQAHMTLQDFMVGNLIGVANPNRVPRSKYYIPDNFYSGFYPAYAGGGGVVYSGLLTKRLYQVSKRIHLFPIDDVYVGMCMLRLQAQPGHHPAFLTFDFPGYEEDAQCAYHTILLVHKRSPNQVIQLWEDIHSTLTQCKDVPLRS